MNVGADADDMSVPRLALGVLDVHAVAVETSFGPRLRHDGGAVEEEEGAGAHAAAATSRAMPIDGQTRTSVLPR